MNITIQNNIADIGLVHDRFTQYATANLEDTSLVNKLSIVIDEVLSNIITYGFNDNEAHKINISCEIRNKEVRLRFTDDGIPFNPLKKEIPEVSLVGDDPQVGGLGIKLVKNLADYMEYNRVDDFNQLQIIKYIN